MEIKIKMIHDIFQGKEQLTGIEMAGKPRRFAATTKRIR
jgi:hypothetical protein